MITDFFKATKKLGIGLALGSALAMSASPAFAGGKARYYEKDFSDREVRLVKLASQKVSNKLGGVTFLVYGGNEKLQDIARSVAKRLNAEGMPIGFIKAVDRDTLLQTMHVDFYTKGGTKFYSTIYDNDKNSTESSMQGLYEQAKKAYEYEFGKTAKKSPTNDAPVLAAR